jgi:thioredoxin-related protein
MLNTHELLFRRGFRRMGLGKNCVKKIFMTDAKMKLMLLLPGYILGWQFALLLGYNSTLELISF